MNTEKWLSYKNSTERSYNDSLSDTLHDTLSLVYTEQEFLEKWWHIPWAEYLLMYRPEICQHKDILEKIRNTRRVDSMTLEGEWTEWYVVQISDICLKFKNNEKENRADFEQELDHYKLIESIYLQNKEKNPYLQIPQLQRELSYDTTIAMEYIPWFTLAHHYTLQQHALTEADFKHLLEDSDDDDILLITERLEGNYNNLFVRLKDHELRTLLVWLGISSEEIEQNGAKNTLTLLEGALVGKNKTKLIQAYKHWKKALENEWIVSIDDHGENLKIFDNCLYALDFWNIIFSSSS